MKGGDHFFGPWMLHWRVALYRTPESLRQIAKREQDAIQERKADRTYRMLMWWRRRHLGIETWSK